MFKLLTLIALAMFSFSAQADSQLQDEIQINVEVEQEFNDADITFDIDELTEDLGDGIEIYAQRGRSPRGRNNNRKRHRRSRGHRSRPRYPRYPNYPHNGNRCYAPTPRGPIYCNMVDYYGQYIFRPLGTYCECNTGFRGHGRRFSGRVIR